MMVRPPSISPITRFPTRLNYIPSRLFVWDGSQVMDQDVEECGLLAELKFALNSSTIRLRMP